MHGGIFIIYIIFLNINVLETTLMVLVLLVNVDRIWKPVTFVRGIKPCVLNSTGFEFFPRHVGIPTKVFSNTIQSASFRIHVERSLRGIVRCAVGDIRKEGLRPTRMLSDKVDGSICKVHGGIFRWDPITMNGIIRGIGIPSIEGLLIQQWVLVVAGIQTRIHPSGLRQSRLVFVHRNVHVICIPIVFGASSHENVMCIKSSVKRMVRTAGLTKGSNATVNIGDTIEHVSGQI